MYTGIVPPPHRFLSDGLLVSRGTGLGSSPASSPRAHLREEVELVGLVILGYTDIARTQDTAVCHPEPVPALPYLFVHVLLIFHTLLRVS